FALLFAWYLEMGMKSHSPTKDPEKLYREGGFMAYIIFLSIIVVILLNVHIPWLERFVKPLVY
ncbi:MAG: UbiA prenyltransferase family protein, partial [Gammaproteobacteria bacterium]